MFMMSGVQVAVYCWVQVAVYCGVKIDGFCRRVGRLVFSGFDLAEMVCFFVVFLLW